MNTLSALSLLPENKKQKEAFVNNAVNEILEGNYCPIQIYTNLDVAIKTLTDIQKNEDVKNYVIEKLAGEKKLELYNCEISLSERKSYNYENDSYWCELNNKLLELKEKIKAHEAVLKSLKSELANVDTGEVLSLPIVTASNVLTVKMK